MRERIEELARRFQAASRERQEKEFPRLRGLGMWPTIAVSYGKRYARIITKDSEAAKGGSVAGFVDVDNGDILYPKGWKGPVKGARGSVLADDYGMSAFGRYGVRTLR